nr:PREDICTED: uncharacterized protein LOC107080062 isoform X2 [Lepisosteus oculatus]
MSEQQAFKQSPNLKPACPPLPVSGCPASLFKAEKRKGPFNRSREGNDLGRERRACGAKRTAGGVSRPGLASGSCSWRSADSCAKGEGGQASVERCQPKPRQAAGVPVVTLVPFSMRGPRAWAGGPLSLPNQVSSREAGLHTTWSGQRLRLLQSQADIRLCHQRKELTKVCPHRVERSYSMTGTRVAMRPRRQDIRENHPRSPLSASREDDGSPCERWDLSSQAWESSGTGAGKRSAD